MTIESQVTSLEISRRLKELGVEQETLWYWSHIDGKYILVLNHGENHAFTVAELGEMLPIGVWSTRDKGEEGWRCKVVFHDPRIRPPLHFTVANTEADARGKMMIYLIENGLVDLPAYS